MNSLLTLEPSKHTISKFCVKVDLKHSVTISFYANTTTVAW